MSWTLLEEDEFVNSESYFSSADRTALVVSPVMRDRLRPGLGEATMNSAGPDTLFFFDRQSFQLQSDKSQSMAKQEISLQTYITPVKAILDTT